MIICDSGYDSEANVVFIYENELKSLIMPKIISRYINNQMRTNDKDLEKLSGEITIVDDNSLEKNPQSRYATNLERLFMQKQPTSNAL